MKTNGWKEREMTGTSMRDLKKKKKRGCTYKRILKKSWEKKAGLGWGFIMPL